MTTTTARPGHLNPLHSIVTAPSGHLVLVDVPMATYLMLDGTDAADGREFEDAVATLLEVSAQLRMFVDEPGELFGPMPVEILRPSVDDPAWEEAVGGRHWTAMTPQPASVTPALLAVLRERLPIRADPAVVRRLRIGSLREGLCAQVTVPGGPSGLSDLRLRFLAQIRVLGYEPCGPQHEIHIATLRPEGRVPVRSVLRQPIRRAW